MRKSEDPFIIPTQLENSKKNKLGKYIHNEIIGNDLGEDVSLWLGKVVSEKKSFLFLLFIIFIFLILFSRLFVLQIIKGDYYRQLTEGNRIRLEYLIPSRGIIFDQWAKPLVENDPSFSLVVNPQELNLSDKERASNILEGYLSREKADELKRIFESKNYSTQIIKENISYDEAIKLIIDLNDLAGFKVEMGSRRHYPIDSVFSHLIGYTSRINQAEKEQYLNQGYLLTEQIGRSGLEKIYQNQLRGVMGKKRVEVDSLSREQKIIAQEDAQAGKNLFLNIDAALQEKIVQILAQKIPKLTAAVIAMDPNNGKVRALVSWPLYDHNAFAQGMSGEEYQKIVSNPLNPLFNRVISGEYPSGSTIKLVVGSAGLQENLVTINSQVLSNGGVWYDKWFFPDWKAGGHGYTNIIKALAESVNTYFYYLALENFNGYHGLGLTKMLAYFNTFGLGRLTGIDLDNESAGFVPSAEWKEKTKGEVWYPGDTLHLAIGQGDILVTPLQVANYTSVIANGGILYQPQLVDKIIDPADNSVQQFTSKIINSHLVDVKNLDIIKEGMRAAVTGGSARAVSLIKIPLAGKTGTAQSSGSVKPHSWFTSFGPWNDPELVLTVLVENGGESTDTAVPVAKEIWQWYAENRFNE